MAKSTAPSLPPLPVAGPRPGVVYPDVTLPRTLRTVRTQAVAALLTKKQQGARHAKPPRPWVAIPLPTALFVQVTKAPLYVLPVCECAACVTALDTALAGRRTTERGRARLLLVEIGGPPSAATTHALRDHPRLMVARGLRRRAGNLEISRAVACLLQATPVIHRADMLPTGALVQGHLVSYPQLPIPRMAHYLVSRLPAPGSFSDTAE